MININKKFFLIIFVFCFVVFLFTNDGHRYTFDEDLAHQQLKKITSLEPDPDFVYGESRKYYEYPELFPPLKNKRPFCENYVVCSYENIGHTITQIPFFLINQNFSVLEKDFFWTTDDFIDPHYVFWRNSMDPSIVFLELTYGPIFISLSIGVFFLICQTFNISRKVSIFTSFIFAFATPIWAYSQTSLNVVPLIFFTLFSYFMYRKYQISNSKKHLIFCSLILGFAFLIRTDVVLFIIPIFFLQIFETIRKNSNIFNLFLFSITPIIFYVIYQQIKAIKFQKITSSVSSIPIGIPGNHSTLFYEGFLGLFISPSVGLFMFSPILFSVFFSFVDFFKNHKKECLLFISFFVLFIVFYATLRDWHGLNGWSARYVIPLVPFMLIPLAYSLEIRKNKILKIILAIPISFGVFTNIIYVLQDVSWFVWGQFGGSTGLYGIGKMTRAQMRLDPSVIWTFDNSQITHSFLELIQRPQIDIFLYKILGPELYALSLILLLGSIFFLLIHTLWKSNALISKNSS